MKEYLDLPPEPEDIAELKNEAGDVVAYYLPHKVVIKYLDELTDGHWSVRDFHMEVHRFKNIWMSGWVEVDVHYKKNASDEFMIFRTLSGAATIETRSMMPNTHWAATLKSLAIVNAVQPLGRRFGLYLNDDVQPAALPETDAEEPASKADKKIEQVRKMMQNAKTLEELESFGKFLIPVELKKEYEELVNAFKAKQ